jgi:hypothetical protein
MWLPRNSARAITTQGRWRPASFALLFVVICALHAGCGGPAPSHRIESALVAGRESGPVAGPTLAPAVRLAKRFADAYVRSIYRPRPPRLPGAALAVERHLLAAAAHVPLARRNHHPRAGAVRLEPRSASVLGASVLIEDRSSPSFSVSFTVARRDGRWRVVAISPPS